METVVRELLVDIMVSTVQIEATQALTKYKCYIHKVQADALLHLHGLLHLSLIPTCCNYVFN